MPNDLKGEIHSNFSTDSSTWSNFRSEVTGAYILSGQGGEVGRQHLLREYNRKIDNLSLSGGLYLEPYNAGFSYMGTPDLYTGATAAYSTRTVGFGGSLMRVRRNSDNSEVDVRGDVNGDISLNSPIIDYRENLLTYSEDFSQGYWQKQASTQVPNAGTDPNGENEATKIVPDSSTTNVGLVRAWGSTLDNEVYTWSVYVKKGLSDWISFIESAGATRVWFNVATGAVGTVGSGWSNATITSVGSGWYRISATVTAGGSNDYLYVIQVDANGGHGVTKDGDKGMLVWGAQLNKGSTLEKYIKTDGSAITELDRPQESFGTFMGTATGYCSIWYDQTTTGSDRINAIQTTASLQPILVDGGALVTSNDNKAALHFLGHSSLLTLEAGFNASGDFYFVHETDSAEINWTYPLSLESAFSVFYGPYATKTSDEVPYSPYYAGDGFKIYGNDTLINTGVGVVASQSIFSGLSGKMLGSHINATTADWANWRFGRGLDFFASSLDFSGKAQEWVFYPSGSDQTGIQNGINNYFKIY